MGSIVIQCKSIRQWKIESFFRDKTFHFFLSNRILIFIVSGYFLTAACNYSYIRKQKDWRQISCVHVVGEKQELSPQSLREQRDWSTCIGSVVVRQRSEDSLLYSHMFLIVSIDVIWRITGVRTHPLYEGMFCEKFYFCIERILKIG